MKQTHRDCKSCGAKESIPNEAQITQKLTSAYALLQSHCVVCGTTVTVATVRDGKVEAVA